MLIFSSLLIGCCWAASMNVAYHINQDCGEDVYYVSKSIVGTCTPEACVNGREVVCKQGGVYWPPNAPDINLVTRFYNSDSCTFIPPGNSNSELYLNGYCGPDPLNAGVFLRGVCNDIYTLTVETFSDAQCTTRLTVENYVTTSQESCVGNSTANTSYGSVCATNNVYTTIMTTTMPDNHTVLITAPSCSIATTPTTLLLLLLALSLYL